MGLQKHELGPKHRIGGWKRHAGEGQWSGEGSGKGILIRIWGVAGSKKSAGRRLGGQENRFCGTRAKGKKPWRGGLRKQVPVGVGGGGHEGWGQYNRLSAITKSGGGQQTR